MQFVRYEHRLVSTLREENENETSNFIQTRNDVRMYIGLL